MSETATAETQVQEQSQPQGQEAPQQADPFQLDEAVLATLTPEQRQGLDSITTNWKSKAQELIKKESEAAVKKFEGYEEYQKKAKVFDQLTNDQRFQQWWRELQTSGSRQQQAQAQQNVLQTIGSSNEEYAQAVQEAASGDPTRLNQLQLRMQQAWAQPVIKGLQDGYQKLQTQMDIDGLFKRHPDAEKLNNIVDKKTGLSLLEAAAQIIVDGNKGSWEDAYDFARNMYETARSESKQEALGMIQSKKDSVTEGGPKQTRDQQTTIEVDSSEKALKQLVRASLEGRSNVNYVSKRRFGR